MNADCAPPIAAATTTAGMALGLNANRIGIIPLTIPVHKSHRPLFLSVLMPAMSTVTISAPIPKPITMYPRIEPSTAPNSFLENTGITES